ncbi:MAG: phytanoyl-CoA dioxygenase family protein [Gammaproteobacteria bacterium]|nr:phytanoyl-CoA dioxygenase family protein [Gammaproteobacteria bacterium]
MLSTADMNAFARDGFVGPFELPAPQREHWLQPGRLKQIHQVLNGGKLNKEQERNQHLYSASLLNLVTAPPILEQVCTMLGENVLLWVAHILSRAPGSGGQAWHSDSINQYIRGIHASIALTDMTLENGCLSVVPGSHLFRTSLWAHEQARGLDRRDADSILRLADESAPWNAPHALRHMELHAGQYFFTWGGLWHGVGKNDTPRPRIACVGRYCRPDFQCRDYGFRDDRIALGELQPCLLIRGRDDFHLNDIRLPPAGDIY